MALLGGEKQDKVKRYNVTDKIHPTQKPIDLIREILLVSSNKQDLVLDPFMGSGTTGRVCDKLGRSFVGYDLKGY